MNILLDSPVAAPDSVYLRLFDQAERVRWHMTDIPWADIEDDKVDDLTLASVRNTVIQEFTTFTATQQFMSAFYDDIEFSEWIAVWFYEETKHPQALERWLRHFGVHVTPAEVLEGRKTHPFMNSRIGTLGINVITEMTASTLYLASAELYREPVLQLLVRNLGSDEARHAASFYAFAERLLATSTTPVRDRRDLLLVLLLWLTQPRLVRHPTSLASDPIADGSGHEAEIDQFRRRVMATFGRLLGEDIRSEPDVRGLLTELRAASRTERT